METPDRIALAQKRLLRVLGNHTVASARTLEQKISDAGPFPQRIDPHILTAARDGLAREGKILVLKRSAPWFYLPGTPEAKLKERLAAQEAIHSALGRQNLTMRVGQALEIAIFKGLLRQEHHFFGGFTDLDSHSDATLFSKEEPPSTISGRTLPQGKKLDFAIITQDAGLAGIEAKNLREWLYPHSEQFRALFFKCCILDAVPVMIARRLPYAAFSVLNPCGVILHQMYNQLFPLADAALGERAKDKNLLGYHDLRIGNDPDSRLAAFLQVNLPKVLPEARRRFAKFKDLLLAYGTGELNYKAFAGIAIRRAQSLNIRPPN
jgi:hypothetical protein